MAASRNISTYRPEIQGIRTIGALLVACFHIWGGRVSGGVDVFFVISGFLITGSLYKEVRANRTINVVAFWGRIAKRIAPTAYAVMTLTLLAAMLWLPATRQEDFLEEVFYSAFHLENLRLSMDMVDYLARDEAPSPVQQFWALSVQVQFYAVWPLFLIVVAAVGRRLRHEAAVTVFAIAVILLISLTYSIILTRQDPAPAYFNVLARVWEFALGGLVAITLPSLTLPSSARLAAGWLGLFLVISCGFVIPQSAAFPGYVALWPTFGAVLILLSGGDAQFGANRILASKPLVALGDISFAFYLWHWPVLTFALLITGRTQLGISSGLVVIGIALCGACATTRWLEQPIQQSSVGRRKTWHVHAMAAAMAVPLLLGAGVWHVLVKKEVGEGLIAAQYPGGTIAASRRTALKTDIPLRPSPAAAKKDVPKIYHDRCDQDRLSAEIIQCSYGSDKAARTIALVGGSHSVHWFAALEVLSEQYSWRIINITKSTCPLEVNAARKPSCVEWNEKIIGHLAELKPDVVFTTSTRRSGKRGEYVPEGYLEQWSRLAEKGISVIAVRDNPWMKTSVPECLERAGMIIVNCSLPRKLVMDDTDPASRLNPKPTNVSFIDMTDRFCDRSLCFPVSGNILIYSDAHHITATFSRSMASVLGKRMKQVRPDLFTTELLGAMAE